MRTRIAIIGAGLAGLTLARELSDIADIRVFEKARGVGGRMSTRYADPFMFDHGVQFFTARNAQFQNYIAPLLADGSIAEWTGKIITFETGKTPDKSLWFEPHYVAVPNMNSLCKKLSEDVEVALGTEISPLAARRMNGWPVTDKDSTELGCYDWVISTAPPVQTQRLFGPNLPADAPLLQSQLLGCYTLMIGFKRPWDRQWIAATIRNNPLQWLAVNSTKPGRDAGVTCLVAHSSHEWAEEHINDDLPSAQAYLASQLESASGMQLGDSDYLSTHRWRYANLANRHPLKPYIDTRLKLASVGDWCGASRVEEVWLAAHSLACSMRVCL